MSGDGKRSAGHWPQATAPILNSYPRLARLPLEGRPQRTTEGPRKGDTVLDSIRASGLGDRIGQAASIAATGRKSRMLRPFKYGPAAKRPVPSYSRTLEASGLRGDLCWVRW